MVDIRDIPITGFRGGPDFQIFGLLEIQTSGYPSVRKPGYHVAGMNERDMKFALDIVRETQGGIVIVNNCTLIAKVELPIAGLLSDKRANVVAEENKIFKDKWLNAGCTLPYMGFNLLPLSVIPNFRITNKGLVDVNTMKLIPLFE